MDLDERVSAVKAAVAEAGWPSAKVFPHPDEPDLVGVDKSVPMEVTWRAFWLVREPDLSCWPCWSASWGSNGDSAEVEECSHDPYASDAVLPPIPERGGC